MDGRKSFLLRVDAELLDDLRHWADDELRSLNGQIEYLLRRAVRENSRGQSEARAREQGSKPEPQDDVE